MERIARDVVKVCGAVIGLWLVIAFALRMADLSRQEIFMGEEI
jgi:hypothetical protein